MVPEGSARPQHIPTPTVLMLLAGTILLALTGRVGAPRNIPPVALSAASYLPQPHGGNDAATHAVRAAYGALPLSFEANRGQADGRADFLSRGAGYTLSLAADKAVLALGRSKSVTNTREGGSPDIGEGVLRMQLVGSDPRAAASGLERLPGAVNYLLGSDPARWRTNIPTYASVVYRAVYPGIDLVYYGNRHELEYDFIVAPGADPSPVALRFAGADDLSIDRDGDLLLRLGEAEVRLRRPLLYQEREGVREEVAGRYALASADMGVDGEESPRVSFEIDAYDRTRPLVIDPVLVYASYLGGGGDDAAYAVAVDSSGQTSITGTTRSADFPLNNPRQATLRGGADAFVAKLNSAGSALIYATYIGGGGEDEGRGIAVDADGNAYITGSTTSADFPTSGPFQPATGGGTDAFVAKLNAAGSTLLYATYLGGSGSDAAASIAVDPQRHAAITGTTDSTNFPTRVPLQRERRGFTDAFVTRLDPAGGALVYSTYLGGTRVNEGRGIAVNAAGDAFVTGLTTSPTFPTTANALQEGAASESDAFIARISSGGTTLQYATFLGGSGLDAGFDIAVDAESNAYVTGHTDSDDFPLFTPLQAVRGGGRDAFLAKLNPAGTALGYATYFGGRGHDRGLGIAVDGARTVHLAGSTESEDLPRVGAVQSNLGGGSDAFVARLDPSGRSLLFAGYLGGEAAESGEGIALNPTGQPYVAGSTRSSGFPVKNAVQQILGGGSDAFIAHVGEVANPAPVLTSMIPSSTTAGGSAFTLTVSGREFDATSSVHWNGAVRPTTFVTTSELRAAIPATDITTPSTATVTVVTPTGGSSAPLSFSVTARTTALPVTIATAGCRAGASFGGTVVDRVTRGQTATCRLTLQDAGSGVLEGVSSGQVAITASTLPAGVTLSALAAGNPVATVGSAPVLRCGAPAGGSATTDGCAFVDLTVSVGSAAVLPSSDLPVGVTVSYTPDREDLNTAASQVLVSLLQISSGAPPTVTGISPTAGPPAGGTVVTVAGTGFSTSVGATAVAFGTSAATSVSCNATTNCTATSPAGTGTVDLRVTVAGQTSVTAAAARFTYTAGSALAELQAPAPGSTLAGATATLSWTAGTDVQQYYLWVGTSGPGSYNVYAAPQGATSATIGGLPTSGSTVYVRLWSRFGAGTWQYIDYTYTAATASSGTKAAITSPVPNTTLASRSVTLTWSAGTNAEQYALWVGSAAAGSYDLHADYHSGTSAHISGLPASGTIYVRLWTKLGGAWYFTDYTYTACGGCGDAVAEITAPAPGTLLTGASVTFLWSSGTGVEEYYLWAGTGGPGSYDLTARSTGAARTATVEGLLANSGTVYVRLWSRLSAGWQYRDYSYSVCAGCNATVARIVDPVPGSTLPGSSTTFRWNGGIRVRGYYLWIGTSGPGAHDLHAAPYGVALSATVEGLPTNGGTVYLRFWYLLESGWQYTDHIYTAASP